MKRKCLILLLLFELYGCNSSLFLTMSESQKECYHENGLNFDWIYAQSRSVRKQALKNFKAYTGNGDFPDTLYQIQGHITESNVIQGSIWGARVELQYETSYPYKVGEATMSVRFRSNDSILYEANHFHYDFEEYQYLLEEWNFNSIEDHGSIEEPGEIYDNPPLILGTIAFREKGKWRFKNVLFHHFQSIGG